MALHPCELVGCFSKLSLKILLGVLDTFDRCGIRLLANCLPCSCGPVCATEYVILARITACRSHHLFAAFAQPPRCVLCILRVAGGVADVDGFFSFGFRCSEYRKTILRLYILLKNENQHHAERQSYGDSSQQLSHNYGQGTSAPRLSAPEFPCIGINRLRIDCLMSSFISNVIHEQVDG